MNPLPPVLKVQPEKGTLVCEKGYTGSSEVRQSSLTATVPQV